jgi:gamma-glutamyl:cysteine ligase YbdK (ATP-grasp superfamily)
VTAVSSPADLRLFEGYGVEIEYMIVDSGTLSVRPISDELLRAAGGNEDGDFRADGMVWSNELGLHVLELKVAEPSPSLTGLGAGFQAQVGAVNDSLIPFGARLLPTGMHPWMDPATEFRLWPHANSSVYRTFDRIFDCRGHGWANLQATHLNLPFGDDAEFGRLHAAVRLMLPILPGLAASSPFFDGKRGEHLDSRLEVYRQNARRVPSVSGQLVPEPVFTRREYEERLLGRIYRDLAPLDPDGVIRHEWVNARGCIARFGRMAVEIRVLDVQECPAADLAVVGATASVARAMAEEAWCDTKSQRKWDERTLAGIFHGAVRDADESVVDNRGFLDAFGYPERGRARIRDLWQHLIETVVADEPAFADWEVPLRLILEEGCLARRIVRAVGEPVSRPRLAEVYATLADCLAAGEPFRAGA